MLSKTDVERADRKSRARAILLSMLAVMFAASSILDACTHLFFVDVQPWSEKSFARLIWVVLGVLVALNLLTGGCIPRRMRQLMNDDVTKQNRSRALSFGFCAALLCALGIVVVPQTSNITAAGAAFVVASSALCVALASFALLELRATSDV